MAVNAEKTRTASLGSMCIASVDWFSWDQKCLKVRLSSHGLSVVRVTLKSTAVPVNGTFSTAIHPKLSQNSGD